MIATLNSAITSLTSQRAQVNADISKFNFYVQNQENRVDQPPGREFADRGC